MLVAVVCMHVYSQVRIRNNSSFHTSVAGHQCEHRSIHSYWGCKRLGAEEAFILRGNTGERCTCVVPKVKLLRPMKMLTVAEKLITLHVGEEGGSYFLMCKVSLNLIVKTGHCFDFVLLQHQKEGFKLLNWFEFHNLQGFFYNLLVAFWLHLSLQQENKQACTDLGNRGFCLFSPKVSVWLPRGTSLTGQMHNDLSQAQLWNSDSLLHFIAANTCHHECLLAFLS